MDQEKAKALLTPDGWRYEIDHTRHHRRKNWDYRGRGIYHMTLVVAERHPLFGELAGETPEEARIMLSAFGRYVWKVVQGLPEFYEPKGYALKIIAAQMMPDHIHLVLQVLEPMPQSIGSVIRGMKAACTREYKQEYMSGGENATEMHNNTNGLKNETVMHNSGGERTNGWDAGDVVQFAGIFARTGSIWQADPAHYHERILHKKDKLQPLIDYVKDNPRRLALMRANPDLFRIHQQTRIGQDTCTTLGNMFLLKKADRRALQCSRSLTQEAIDALRDECLAEAANGTVYVSAAISEGEKQICRALREAGYPLIILLEEGFPAPDDPRYKYYKPSGVYFEACAMGRLLLVEPEAGFFEKQEIEDQVIAKAGAIPHSAKRYRFLALNELAERIANG